MPDPEPAPYTFPSHTLLPQDTSFHKIISATKVDLLLKINYHNISVLTLSGCGVTGTLEV
jgi:hypothetical protein